MISGLYSELERFVLTQFMKMGLLFEERPDLLKT